MELVLFIIIIESKLFQLVVEEGGIFIIYFMYAIGGYGKESVTVVDEES